MVRATAGAIHIPNIIAIAAIRLLPSVVEFGAAGSVIGGGYVSNAITSRNVVFQFVAVGIKICCDNLAKPIVVIAAIATVSIVARAVAASISVEGVAAVRTTCFLPVVIKFVTAGVIVRRSGIAQAIVGSNDGAQHISVGVKVCCSDLADPVIGVAAVAAVCIIDDTAAGAVGIEGIVALGTVSKVPRIAYLNTIGSVIRFIVVTLRILDISSIAAI